MAVESRFPGTDDGARFRYWLQKLKQRGSNLLITGAVSDDVSAQASQKLFGQKKDRTRILALAGRKNTDPSSRLPNGVLVGDQQTWFIDQHNGERSVPNAATNASSALNSPEESNIQQLYEEVQTAISFYAEERDDFTPASLRLGIDSLYPFLQSNYDRTRRTIQALTTDIQERQGMAHYHAHLPDDAPLVEDLTPLFDARIELRKRRGKGSEHRWHVPEIGETTAWIEL